MERATVQPKTEASCEDATTLFLEFSNVGGRRLVEDAEVDKELVRHFDKRFVNGHPAHEGEVCMPAPMHFVPQFS